MSKYIGRIYKHSQSQLSTFLFKTPVRSSSEPQTLSSIELTTTYVPSVRGKKKKKSVLCSKNSIHNDVSITNNNDIQSCESERKNCSIPTNSTPNHHAQHIANTSSSVLNLHTTMGFPTFGK